MGDGGVIHAVIAVGAVEGVADPLQPQISVRRAVGILGTFFVETAIVCGKAENIVPQIRVEPSGHHPVFARIGHQTYRFKVGAQSALNLYRQRKIARRRFLQIQILGIILNIAVNQRHPDRIGIGSRF